MVYPQALHNYFMFIYVFSIYHYVMLHYALLSVFSLECELNVKKTTTGFVHPCISHACCIIGMEWWGVRRTDVQHSQEGDFKHKGRSCPEIQTMF